MNLEILAGNAASARKQYLANKKPNEYAQMEKAGELDAHLELIGRSAADYYATLMAQMQKQAEERGLEFNYGMVSRQMWELTLEDVVYI
jgi:3-deoxy-D-arabino-heptulosonate 7-phosphate (DAHP) synthase